MKLARVALALACAASAAAWACGVCIDDKVAATFDYGVVERAMARHHVVVFAEARCGAEAGAAAKRLRAAAARVRGVEAASVRSSSAPLTVSFALDPRVAQPATALESLRRNAALPGLELVLLKVQR